jgi:hypothetical protein
VTGAVAHGSHTGAGGGQAATGAGFGQHQLQQPQPALLTTTAARIKTSVIVFMDPSPYRNRPSLVFTPRRHRVFITQAAACKRRKVGLSTIPARP